MAVKRKIYKCRICGVEDIDKDIMQLDIDYIKHGNWYAHKSCYDNKEKIKKELDLYKKTDNDTWRDATHDYLQKVVKLEVNDNVFYVQWNKFLKEKYEAKGMYFAILYFYEIKRGNKDKANGGIGIIPYVYYDSRDYWYDRESRQGGIVAQITQQVQESANRKQVVVTKKDVKPRKFEVDFSVLNNLEDEE